MSNDYRRDIDLEFLAEAENEDLKVLSRYLTHDSDGQKRFTQTLLDNRRFTSNLESNQLGNVWSLIAAELQAYGGDSIANLFRGKGILYKEILEDVCSHKGVKLEKEETILQKETRLLQGLLRQYLASASEVERTKFSEIVGAEVYGHKLSDNKAIIDLLFSNKRFAMIVSALFAASFQQIVQKSAAPIALRIFGTISSRALGSLIPGLNLIIAPTIFTLLTGPAFRVTLPCTLHIAYMRRKRLDNPFEEVTV